MALTKYRLGDLICLSSDTNSNLEFGPDDVKGISIEKKFMDTKANLTNVSLKPYKVVRPKHFSFVTVTSRNGEKISIAYNDSEHSFIVSSLYVVFELNNFGKTVLDERWLYMYFNRTEFDRYARRDSWGSAREYFWFDNICDVELMLPSLDVQRKYADVYSTMKNNQSNYERGIDDLKMICTAFIEKLREDTPLHKIGEYITPYNEKNSDGTITLEQGINIDKQFITPQRGNSNLLGRKIVRRGQFCYCTQLNNENVAIAYREGEDCVVSSVNDVFEITKKDELIPEYLMLWLIRPEFGRYVYWAAAGSAYEFLNYENIANYKIPVPAIDTQRAIGSLYLAYIKRKRINDELKTQIKGLCPILIKGSMDDKSA